MPVLRSLFGRTVNYVDWSDLVVHLLELPYPTVGQLLDLKRQYAALERKRPADRNAAEGTRVGSPTGSGMG